MNGISTKEPVGAGRWTRRARWTAALVAGAVALGACSHLRMMRGGVEPPPASEFGLGPRASAGGRFEATLAAAEPLRTRRLQSLTLSLRPIGGATTAAATVTLAGGMPQHGHGLPTRPRVTALPGGVAYRVDGVRFNMGGWWELRFRIESEAGADSVTFNLAL